MTTSRSTELYVYEAGPVAAPTIVFLHGALVSGRMWEPQLRALFDFHCLAPDMPEHGRSANVSPYRLEDAAHMVAALIAERSMTGKAHVVGLSMGATVGLTLLRMAPERLETLVASGVPAGLGRMMGALLVASGAFYSIMPELTVEGILNQLEVPPAYRVMLREDMLRSAGPGLNGRLATELVDFQLPAVASVPTLAAVGEREPVAFKEGTAQVVKQVAGARGVVAPGGGHMWNLDAPGLFSDMVRAWVMGSALPPELRPLG